MRHYLLIGTCAAVLAGGGVALAQTPPPGPGADAQHGPMAGNGPHGPMNGGTMTNGGEGSMGMMEHHWHHHHFMERGTVYRFMRGDDEVVIACSPREPVQDCVNGASALIDKLGIAGALKPAQ